jgi:hypothetical protein
MSYGQRLILGLRLSAESEEVHGSWCRRMARNAMGLRLIGYGSGRNSLSGHLVGVDVPSLVGSVDAVLVVAAVAASAAASVLVTAPGSG